MAQQLVHKKMRVGKITKRGDNEKAGTSEVFQRAMKKLNRVNTIRVPKSSVTAEATRSPPQGIVSLLPELKIFSLEEDWFPSPSLTKETVSTPRTSISRSSNLSEKREEKNRPLVSLKQAEKKSFKETEERNASNETEKRKQSRTHDEIPPPPSASVSVERSPSFFRPLAVTKKDLSEGRSVSSSRPLSVSIGKGIVEKKNLLAPFSKKEDAETVLLPKNARIIGDEKPVVLVSPSSAKLEKFLLREAAEKKSVLSIGGEQKEIKNSSCSSVPLPPRAQSMEKATLLCGEEGEEKNLQIPLRNIHVTLPSSSCVPLPSSSSLSSCVPLPSSSHVSASFPSCVPVTNSRVDDAMKNYSSNPSFSNTSSLLFFGMTPKKILFSTTFEDMFVFLEPPHFAVAGERSPPLGQKESCIVYFPPQTASSDRTLQTFAHLPTSFVTSRVLKNIAEAEKMGFFDMAESAGALTGYIGPEIFDPGSVLVGSAVSSGVDSFFGESDKVPLFCAVMFDTAADSQIAEPIFLCLFESSFAETTPNKEEDSFNDAKQIRLPGARLSPYSVFPIVHSHKLSSDIPNPEIRLTHDIRAARQRLFIKQLELVEKNGLKKVSERFQNQIADCLSSLVKRTHRNETIRIHAHESSEKDSAHNVELEACSERIQEFVFSLLRRTDNEIEQLSRLIEENSRKLFLVLDQAEKEEWFLDWVMRQESPA